MTFPTLLRRPRSKKVRKVRTQEKERARHIQDEQYERAVRALLQGSAAGNMQYCFVVWKEIVQESNVQQQIEAEKERARHIQNVQYD